MWTYTFILVCVILPCWCRMADDTVEPENRCTNDYCYHKPREACPPPENNCRCKVDDCKTAVICCDVDSFRLSEGLGCANVNLNSQDIKSIHIRNATLDTLNLSEFNTWRRLTSMSITDGRIGSVIGDFKKIFPINCFNLSSNGITKIEDRSLVNLYNLSILDLSHNNISDVPRFKKASTVRLDISDNKSLLCTSLFEAMNRTVLEFENENDTWCLSSKTFHWFNSTELVPLKQVDRVYHLKKDCPKNCVCEPSRLDIVPGKPPTFTVMVSCSSQYLTEFPTPLPPNTIALNVSNNNFLDSDSIHTLSFIRPSMLGLLQYSHVCEILINSQYGDCDKITSLEPLSKDLSYQSLRQLYADNNEITSILPLEGTHFISTFAALSLKNNKLKSVPIYVLSNIFDRNYDSRQVHLGKNKLICDCNTAKMLRVWLLTKQKHIPDYDEIECENMDKKVISLEASVLCQSQHDWTDYIYYIITAEVLLLVFLITKVSYDYWVFKTAGYLPWPASKMPKLPCDWLCE